MHEEIAYLLCEDIDKSIRVALERDSIGGRTYASIYIEMYDSFELDYLTGYISADTARALIAALTEALAAVEGATDGE